jgi:aspartate carbamoyltransferase regulatory subunit
MSKLSEYTVMEHLASGRTARVFKALEKKTNKYVASTSLEIQSNASETSRRKSSTR